MEDGGRTIPSAPPYLPGPTIVLKKAEPVGITVENRLREPTAIHWHGIELESYYDGVAGFSGQGQRITPAIAPGASFEARFTPPRSGTFIYHTHIDEVRQQQAGLSGALVVVDSPADFDTERDWVMLVTIPRSRADVGKVLLNGTLEPPARQMRVGESYRLRFINVHTWRPSMRMRIVRGADVLAWRALAKESGWNCLRPWRQSGLRRCRWGTERPTISRSVPTVPGELRLEVVVGTTGEVLAAMRIDVR